MADMYINGKRVDTSTAAGKKKELLIGILVFMLFVGAAILLGYFIGQIYIDTNIEKNGTVVIGEVTRTSVSEDDDGDRSYTVYYTFNALIDGEYQELTGSCSYSRYMSAGSNITIKYDSKGRSVIAGYYSDSFILNALALIIFFVLFSLVDIYFFIMIIITAIGLSYHIKLERGKGTVTKATFLGMVDKKYGMKVKYCWEDNKGKLREGKSKNTYSQAEIDELSRMGTFDIEYYKNVSRIVTVPVHNTSGQGVTQTIPGLRNGMCEYCGSQITDGSNICPNCGAKNS